MNRKRGLEVLDEMLGKEAARETRRGWTRIAPDFEKYVVGFLSGEVWARPGLDRKTRSCITLTALTALGHFDELALHVRAALRNGLAPDEIKEVLLQAAVYCGVPAANRAFAVAQRTLAEEEVR